MTRRRLWALSIGIPALILGLGAFVHQVVIPWVRLEGLFHRAYGPESWKENPLFLLQEMRRLRPDLEDYLIGKARSRSLEDLRIVSAILEQNPGLDRVNLWGFAGTGPVPKSASEPWVDGILVLYGTLLEARPRDAGPVLDGIHAEALQRIGYWTSFSRNSIAWTDLQIHERPSGVIRRIGDRPLTWAELALKLPFLQADLEKTRREYADWVRAGAGRTVIGTFGHFGEDGLPVRLRPQRYTEEERVGFCRLEEQAPPRGRLGSRK